MVGVRKATVGRAGHARRPVVPWATLVRVRTFFYHETIVSKMLKMVNIIWVMLAPYNHTLSTQFIMFAQNRLIGEVR